ncbi:12469_t:CDS:2 [Cetraspora pellucida]|uniref:12469_t:CDS:1 n=1 Tax=Cetraspora pellucida TaxID=1433469 RepID=A0A9N9G381_9GLOM|nr:12469_t:CDS:2 [Cetraspora pellucida]
MPTNPTFYIETLNKQWHKLSTVIKRQSTKQFQQQNLHILTSTKPPTSLQQIIIQINHLLEKTQTLTNLPIETLSKNSLTYTNFSNTVNQLHTVHSTLYNA